MDTTWNTEHSGHDHGAIAHGAIAVAIDPALSSLESLVWAAREAERSGSRLIVVHALGTDTDSAMDDGRVSEALVAAAMVGHELLAKAQGLVRQVAPRVDVEARVRATAPHRALAEVSTEADLIVLGARTRSDGAAASAFRLVVDAAQCPVVVPRAPERTTQRRVVALVDGTPSGSATLAEAARVAEWLEHPLLVLMALSDPRETSGSVHEHDRLERLEAALGGPSLLGFERTVVVSMVERLRQEHPRLSVSLVTDDDVVDSMLVHLGLEAEVLVLDRRHARRLAEQVLTPSVAHASGCTTIVLPAADPEDYQAPEWDVEHVEVPVVPALRRSALEGRQVWDDGLALGRARRPLAVAVAVSGASGARVPGPRTEGCAPRALGADVRAGAARRTLGNPHPVPQPRVALRDRLDVVRRPAPAQVGFGAGRTDRDALGARRDGWS